MAVRVHELAREFQVESKVILAALKAMGEYVKSASSTVEAPMVLRLRDFLNSPEFKTPERRPAPSASSESSDRSRPGNNPFANRSSRGNPTMPKPVGRSRGSAANDPKLIEAADLFGVSPNSLRPAARPRPKYPPKSSPAKSGTHMLDDWDLLLMDRSERQEWLDAGLGPHDARLAESCKRFGIGPDDLSLVVERRTVWDRLRGNESVTIIADMIRVEKARFRDIG